MKKQIVFFLFSFLAMKFTAQAQSNFDINKDEQSGQTMFVGKCLFDDISEEASFDWFTMSSNNYNPEPTITEQLKKVLPNCQLYIFIGTWCEDTHNLLPKLYKTMLLSRCYTNYKMYGVDRNKKSNNKEEEAYKIINVPTIIVMKDGVELGRIVETTKTSIESDLLKIVEANE
jgi:hypothetical protein